jgi:hypothetical protein
MRILINCVFTSLYISIQMETVMCDWPASIFVAGGCCSSLNSYISVGLLVGCVLKGSVPSLLNLLRWGNKTDRQVLIVGKDSVAINNSKALVQKTQRLWDFLAKLNKGKRKSSIKWITKIHRAQMSTELYSVRLSRGV